MIPTNVILDAIPNLLANDATTIAPVTALKVHLAMAAFTPGASLVVGDLTEATFDGGDPLDAGTGACEVFTDPITLLRVVQFNEPAGGWTWTVSGTTDLPQTIYGFYVTDTAGTVLYGSERLPVNVTLNAVGQAVNVPWIRFTFANGSPQ